MESLSTSRQTIWSDAHGFTLIELMVVVGIIGILVSIASTNFNKYQRKARQSEAKIGLSAIYAAEKSFYSEYNAYITGFDAIGYTPEGNKRFYIAAMTNDCVGGPGVTGYTGANAVACYTRVNQPYTITGTFTGTCAVYASSNYAVDSQVFIAYFHGNLGNATYDDLWTINQNKVLVNCSNGT
jgi:type IV pilus assembly protein PilA